MNTLLNLGKGKLTYLVAGVTIIWAIVGAIIGTLEAMEVTQLVIAGLAVFGIRRAIR